MSDPLVRGSGNVTMAPCADGMCWAGPLCEVIDDLKAERDRPIPDLTPGEFLAARRAELGLGVSEMERATGLPSGLIVQYEQDRWPDAKVSSITRVAWAYRVDPVALFEVWASSPLLVAREALEGPADA